MRVEMEEKVVVVFISTRSEIVNKNLKAILRFIYLFI